MKCASVPRSIATCAIIAAACVWGCDGQEAHHAYGADAGISSSVEHGALSEQQRQRSTILWMADDGLVESDYEVIDGEVVVEGDMVIGTISEVEANDRALRAELNTVEKPHWDTLPRRDWPNGVIPFDIDPAFNATDRRVIERAVSEWNSWSHTTGVRWVPRRIRKDDSGVRFRQTSNGRCNASVGRHRKRQYINLSQTDCIDLGVIAHEMGHALGLRHEHQRTDRDRWLHVMTRNASAIRGNADIHERRPRRYDCHW